MWAAHDAEVKAAGAFVSEEEKELLKTRPSPLKVGQDMTDEHMQFQLKLMAIRAKDLKRARPKPPFYGTIIKKLHQLSSSVIWPKAHPDWRQLLQPRQFPHGTSGSAADAYQTRSQSNHFELDGGAMTLKKEPMPAQLTSSTQYFEAATNLDDFCRASGRFTHEASRKHAKHVAYIMKAWSKYPAADVMLYDDDFRLLRHTLCDHAWDFPDEELVTKRLRNPASERLSKAAEANPDKPQPKPKQPKQPKPKPDPKPSPKSSIDWTRPCYKHRKIDGADVCVHWLWGGCAASCTHKSYHGKPQPLTHKCAYCQDNHRFDDCTALKNDHPDDFAKGMKG